MVVTHRLRRRRHGRQRRGSERRQQGLAHRKSPYLVMIGSGANPSGDQTRRGGGGSGVRGGPMISARSGRAPSGPGGRRSEDGRVGKERVGECRSRGWPSHKKTK